MPAITTIKNRRDTAANWTSTNPTLAAGEFGVETDTRKVKVGNGAATWSALGSILAGSSYDVNVQSGTTTYTITANDAGKLILRSAATGVNDVTIPTDATSPMPLGTVITIIPTNAASLQILGSGGVTIRTTTTAYARSQYSVVGVLKIGDNEWLALGDLRVY